ncbi:YqgU-like beta propeller domain-containing protein [Lederbergia lenta]|uniref:Lipoprotein n=1 Tax=Lederbergia lenta TaxID=1467 RepID=A0A2X4VZ17_LEDLE|nr:hypothetical protein [Lederbergia lenta]MEC2325177.1 hypothetical protein [Lederbergia lenta]SQI56071.1 lipoprotein [Lederbergia lenta]
MRLTVKFCILMNVIIILLLSGCIEKSMDASPSPEPLNKSESNESNSVNLPVVPLDVGSGKFEKSYGWLDDQTILYSYVDKGKYYVSSYELYKGDSEIIFASSTPIVNVIIHPMQEKLLIHTSPSTHGAEVFITDAQGDISFSTEIESYELAIEWNKKDATQMFITAFYEDWTYDIHHLDLSTNNMNKVPHLEPFMKWLGNSVIEQRWNENDEAFFAPLWKTFIDRDKKTELLKDEVYRFDVFSDYLMVITIPKNNQTVFEYQFFDLSMKRKNLLEKPNLTQYADWLIPYYDYNVAENKFITFAPETHASVDTYNDGFKLIELDLDDGKEKELIVDIDNQPISCAASGNQCLYGYQLENLLNLKTGKIEKIMKDNKAE